METALKVLVADDHPLILQGLRRTLEGLDDIELVGDAGSGPELLALIERRRPDIVLLDLYMPGFDGPAGVEEIRGSWPAIKIVVLSACDDRASIDSCLRAGASAYVIKSVHSADLPSVLRQVSAGGMVFHAPSTSSTPGDESAGDDTPTLTERETTILEAVAGGLTTKAISHELWLSEHTVKFHLTNIYRKLGVSNRSGAVRQACACGLVSAGG
jgi:DNA-binding NarL/FixJ family response regulator